MSSNRTLRHFKPHVSALSAGTQTCKPIHFKPHVSTLSAGTRNCKPFVPEVTRLVPLEYLKDAQIELTESTTHGGALGGVGQWRTG